MSGKKAWGRYLFFILLALGAGGISGWLSAEGMRVYSAEAQKPPLTPPDAVFPIVWTALYVLMGIGAARVSMKGREGWKGLRIWSVQLMVNFSWSLIFFNIQAYFQALICLAVLALLVLAMILEFFETDRRAAFMQIPYFFWLCFAGYLNFGVWMLNS